jgi:hypothetical protein
MIGSNNGHVEGSAPVVGSFWYTGTDAIKEGEAFCFDSDRGTATAVDGKRNNYIERPSITNSKGFAGVALGNHSAQSTGQMIQVAMPGSKGVKIALAVDTVLDTGLLSFQAGGGSGAGRFYTGKYLGRGSAIPRQTVAAVLEDGVLGTWSVAVDGITLTVTATAGLAAGDTVVLQAGEQETATEYIVPGKYIIASVTDATDMVLASSCVSDTPAAAVLCTGYAYTGNPVCQADLLTGDESGGVEFVSYLNAGNAAQPHMVGGVSYVMGGDVSGDVDIVLAQGTLPGEVKAVVCLADIATNDLTVDPATDGLKVVGTTLAAITGMDTAADAVYFEFGGGLWRVTNVVGGATET